MLPQPIRQRPQPNTRKKVDGIPRIPRLVPRKQLPVPLPRALVLCLEPLCQPRHPHRTRHLLHQNLEKNPGGTGSLVLIQFDGGETGPRE